jgi:hypothetical protein
LSNTNDEHCVKNLGEHVLPVNFFVSTMGDPEPTNSRKDPNWFSTFTCHIAQNPICKAKLITNKKDYDPFFPDFVKNMHTNDEAEGTFFLPALSLVCLLPNAAKNVIAAIQIALELQQASSSYAFGGARSRRHRAGMKGAYT